MRTGIATSAKLFRSWFYHWQQNFCIFHFHYFVTPRPARKIILGNLLHGRMPRTVSSHHRLLGMVMLAGKPDCGFQLENSKVDSPENGLAEFSLSDVDSWNRNATMAIFQTKSRRESSYVSETEPSQPSKRQRK